MNETTVIKLDKTETDAALIADALSTITNLTFNICSENGGKTYDIYTYGAAK